MSLKWITAAALTIGLSTSASAKETLETVNSVDLKLYAGTWYEIAKLPNRFQKKCVGNTTANYASLENGNVRVENVCEKEDGSVERVVGEARIENTKTNAQLKVAFFKIFGKWIFNGDYYVIGLDSKYQWSVVGAPGLKYGWILARTPSLSEDTLAQIYKILESKGYKPCEFVMTPQADGFQKSEPLCEL